MRTLAVYGLPIWLLASGPLIDGVGFAATAAIYGAAGMAAALCGVRPAGEAEGLESAVLR